METESRLSYTRTLQEQTSVYLSVSPPKPIYDASMEYLSVFSDFACFSQTLTLKVISGKITLFIKLNVHDDKKYHTILYYTS